MTSTIAKNRHLKTFCRTVAKNRHLRLPEKTPIALAINAYPHIALTNQTIWTIDRPDMSGNIGFTHFMMKHLEWSGKNCLERYHNNSIPREGENSKPKKSGSHTVQVHNTSICKIFKTNITYCVILNKTHEDNSWTTTPNIWEYRDGRNSNIYNISGSGTSPTNIWGTNAMK